MIFTKGYKQSKEHTAKVAAANRGKKRTPQQRENISKSMKNHEVSEATLMRMSAAQKKRYSSSNNEQH